MKESELYNGQVISGEEARFHLSRERMFRTKAIEELYHTLSRMPFSRWQTTVTTNLVNSDGSTFYQKENTIGSIMSRLANRRFTIREDTGMVIGMSGDFYTAIFRRDDRYIKYRLFYDH